VTLPHYPVSDRRDDILSLVTEPGVAILEAPTGSGKSTLVPLFLLNSPDFAGYIYLLQPRRAAARSIHQRIDQLLGGTRAVASNSVASPGLLTRDDRIEPKNCRITVMTEGVFVRLLIDQPELPGVSLVIFDEFHERSLDVDLGLVLSLDSFAALRPDLRVLLMSATLDSVVLPGIADSKPPRRLQVPGRLFPLDIRHQLPRPQEDVASQVVRAVGGLLLSELSHGLVFLPGEPEIHRVRSRLIAALPTTSADGRQVLVLPLFSRLPLEEQAKALGPPEVGTVRIVLATNMAETSLTIPDTRWVVDSGLVRKVEFDPARGLNRRITVRVSAASAAQRAGRAGRTGPGIVVRLWPEVEILEPAEKPEILTTDLSSLVLGLAAWGNSDSDVYLWPTPPPPERFDQAKKSLQEIGALDFQGQLTVIGKQVYLLPVEPLLAYAILQAPASLRESMVRVVALLEEGDPFPPTIAKEVGANLEFRLGYPLGRNMEREVARLSRALRNVPSGQGRSRSLAEHWVTCFPRLVARRVTPIGLIPAHYQVADGRTMDIRSGDRAYAPEWIAITDAEQRGTRGQILLALEFDDRTLQILLNEREEVRESLEMEGRSIFARRSRYLGQILLNQSPLSLKDLKSPSQKLATVLQSLGPQWVSPSKELTALLGRLEFLAEWAGWPGISLASIIDSAPQWLAGFLPTKLDSQVLDTLPWVQIVQNQIPWELRSQIDRLTPTKFDLPSGQTIKLEYRDTKCILALKVQQAFGLTQTPRVAGQPVEVHLLSPAGWPIQITQDLESFWRTTYPQVRKELRGRYPKHKWPEDPVSS